MKRIISIILQTIFYLAIGVVILTFASSKFAIFGLRSFTVVTGSMEPRIHVGSIVFTIPAKEYRIGDILTFQRGNVSITHRIIAIKNGEFQVKGDANNSPDPILVAKQSAIGKDFLIIPYLGKFTNFLKTVPGFIIFIAIPILIYVLLEARIFKREWEKHIEEKVMDRISPFGFKIS